jgi:hypothetical protein
MCFWLIRNKPDWRQTMPVGSWLNNLPVGDGAASVSVDDDNHNFTDDPTQPVTISATGSCGNRAFAFSATVRPTGGGTIFKNGNFVTGNLSLGNSDLILASVLDSYNSSLAAYNPLLPGANASFASNSIANGALKCYAPSFFRGSYTAAPTADLASVIQLLGAVPGPSATGHALENRDPGNVVFPNTAGLPTKPAVFSSGTVQAQVDTSGFYGNITAINGGIININGTGTYYVDNDIALGSTGVGTINVQDGAVATVVVHGNVGLNSNSKIVLIGNDSRLNLYVQGNVTLNNGSINSGGNTSHVILFGGPDSGTIRILNTNGAFCGAIYAPQHDVIMQTNGPKFFGALVAKSLTLKNTAAFHFDEALRSLKIGQITAGTAPAGTPDYQITINSGPTIPR